MKNTRLRAAFGAAALAAALVIPSLAPAASLGAPARREPETRYSQKVKALQDEFNRAARDVAVVMIDRDWLELNQAFTGADLSDHEDRNLLLADYIEQRLGITADPGRMPLDKKTNPLEESGKAYITSFRALTGRDDPERQRVCLAFTHDPHLDAETKTRKFLGLKSEIHTNIAARPLRDPLPLEALDAYTDYHEAAHCTDERLFQVSAADGALAQVVGYHRAEMYADVMATLLLARDGVTDVAHRRADLRLASGALNGPVAVFYKQPEDEQEYYSAFIYAVHDALRATQGEIDRIGPEAMKAMTIPEMRALARRLTDAHALGAVEAGAVVALQKNGYNLSKLEKDRGKSPEAERAYQYAAALRAAMNEALPRVLDLDHLNPRRDALGQIMFSYMRPGPAAAPDNGRSSPGDLRKIMIARAGGRAPEALIRAYSALKDEQRARLLSSSPDERRAAMRDLAAMEEAIGKAARKTDPMREKKPGAPGFAPGHLRVPAPFIILDPHMP